MFFTIVLNVAIVLAVLVLHEAGHYMLGKQLGCTDFKVVLYNEDGGTYTQMRCAAAPGILFPIAGAMILVLPFALSFLLFRKFPEEKLFWVAIGYNLVISAFDIPGGIIAQTGSVVWGLAAIGFGQLLLIDRLLSLILRVKPRPL